jgi:hypothetical protein
MGFSPDGSFDCDLARRREREREREERGPVRDTNQFDLTHANQLSEIGIPHDESVLGPPRNAEEQPRFPSSYSR